MVRWGTVGERLAERRRVKQGISLELWYNHKKLKSNSLWMPLLFFPILSGCWPLVWVVFYALAFSNKSVILNLHVWTWYFVPGRHPRPEVIFQPFLQWLLSKPIHLNCSHVTTKCCKADPHAVIWPLKQPDHLWATKHPFCDHCNFVQL